MQSKAKYVLPLYCHDELLHPGYDADCTMKGHDGKSWEVHWLDFEIVGCQCSC